ncbi:MAG: 6-bladed beta-propeller [Armatimonadetes bacterium]|nr:6-bladed beta-propeller [Armatimonadota bacterium]
MDNFSRREFLRLSGAAVVASTALPIFGQEKQMLILGSGEHKYECIHDWLTPPQGLLFGDTHGVAQDAAGNIYVAHTVGEGSPSKDCICVYTSSGQFIRSWGSQFEGGAHGLDIRKEGAFEYIYHCDVNHRKVVKTRLDGEVQWEISDVKASGKYSKGENFIPTNVAFSPDGDFFLGDGYGSSWIHRFDRHGNYKTTIGERGSGKGEVNSPHGLWVDDRSGEPLLAVADRGNRRIQYFSLEGKHIKFVTEGMRMPCHFSIQGELMVIPDLESVVTIVDKDNKVVVHLGDGKPSNLRGHPKNDFISGKFIHPHDTMFLANGDILVAEWVPQGRVTLLRKVKA